MLHILLVDDDRDTVDTMACVLRSWGHDVSWAYDSTAALGLAAEVQAQVVLLDLVMPGLDGLELAHRIRQQPGMAQALLICMSGYGTDQYRQRARAAGIDHYLLKPLVLADLRRLLDDFASSLAGC